MVDYGKLYPVEVFDVIPANRTRVRLGPVRVDSGKRCESCNRGRARCGCSFLKSHVLRFLEYLTRATDLTLAYLARQVVVL